MHWLPAPGGLLKKVSRQAFIVTSFDSNHDWYLGIEERHCILAGYVGFQFLKCIIFFSSPMTLSLLVSVSSLSGFVSEAYRGINLDRYPIMPRKLLNSAFDSGGLQSWMACTFSGVALKSPWPNC